MKGITGRAIIHIFIMFLCTNAVRMNVQLTMSWNEISREAILACVKLMIYLNHDLVNHFDNIC